MGKPKLLLFSDWFFPGYKAGGPIKSVTNLSIALQQQMNVYVFTSDTDLNNTQSYSGIQSNEWIKPINDSDVQVFYCSKNELTKNKIEQIIEEIQPSVVYLNHMWSYWFVLQPLLICWWKFKKIKIVLCPRGALFPSALHYQRTFFKKKALLTLIKFLGIHKKIHFHATTIHEKDTIKKNFGDVKIHIANNLPDLHQEKLSRIEKSVGELKIAFIARIVDIKNLLILLNNLNKLKQAISLTIAGPAEDEAYWNDCKKVIETFPENITVNYAGEIKPEQVMPLISRHHLYCLPTRGENFGHSIFEAFLIGRPVLISNKTPWLELQSKQAGWDVDIEPADCLKDYIECAANWTQDEFDTHCKGAWEIANNYIHNPNLITDYNQMFLN